MDSYRSPWLNQTRLTGEFKWLSRESSFRGSLKSFSSPYISLLMIPTLKLLEYTRNAKLAFTNLVDHSGFTVTRDYIYSISTIIDQISEDKFSVARVF